MKRSACRVIAFCAVLSMGGCASIERTGAGSVTLRGASPQANLSPVEPESYNESRESDAVSPSSGADEKSVNVTKTSMTMLASVDWPGPLTGSAASLDRLFSENSQVKVASEKMPVADFIHYIFGDLLRVSYVMDNSIEPSEEADSMGVTLSLGTTISQRALFNLTVELMLKNGIGVTYGDGIFYLAKQEDLAQRNLAVGIGRNIDDVPNTTRDILQVVPLKYGVRIGVERTLKRLLNATITPDFDQSVIFVEGDRASIIRALELVNLLDTPASRGRYVGLVGLDFLTPEDFSRDVAVLLTNEGIEASVGDAKKRNVVLVPLSQIGAVIVFAVDGSLLNRVRYWAEIIDVPAKGDKKQYFTYYPEYARAVDLGESVGNLLGASGSAGVSGEAMANASSTGKAPSAARVTGVSTDSLKMVVDERANVLVFYTSGIEYRSLLPLMQKLDTLPKQVQLDITIAEVSLADEFKYGVEWALSRSEVNLTTAGAFGVAGVGGLGLIINGSEGPMTANFLNSNSLVNILSQPTLMVRDGVTANINVGSDISVVGQTTQDPINGERQTTSSEYRKTGVDVTVTPTINARGVVVMEISQSISNSVPDTSGAGGNPNIFARTLSTELVARSGQTIMMAGLISENSSVGGSGTPLLSKIPFIGNLFKSSSNGSDRTELIMLITPTVIDSLDQWETVLDQFQEGLRQIDYQSFSDE